jgi:hypothetical protein
VAAVLTPVQTKPIRINIDKPSNIKHSTYNTKQYKTQYKQKNSKHSTNKHTNFQNPHHAESTGSDKLLNAATIR